MTQSVDGQDMDLTALPYGYSVYRSVFDDRGGYEPVIVGETADSTGLETILIALSPGQYISGMIKGQGGTAGQSPEGSRKLILDALAAVRAGANLTRGPGAPGPPHV